MEDYGRAYWRNRRHILSVPNDCPMTPRPSFPPMCEQPCDSPASPLAAETDREASAKSSEIRIETDRNSFTHTHYKQIWTPFISVKGDDVTFEPLGFPLR